MTSTSVLKSARFENELQTSVKLKTKKELKVIAEKTEKKISAFKNCLKGEITTAQKLELEERAKHLQKTVIRYSLLLGNHLVRFYKTLYDNSSYSDSSRISGEKNTFKRCS